MSDNVNHPKHYTKHPSGVECIQITEHFNFNLGNVIKYVWRAGLKNDRLEDLKKAEFYLRREINRAQGMDQRRNLSQQDMTLNQRVLTNDELAEYNKRWDEFIERMRQP